MSLITMFTIIVTMINLFVGYNLLVKPNELVIISTLLSFLEVGDEKGYNEYISGLQTNKPLPGRLLNTISMIDNIFYETHSFGFNHDWEFLDLREEVDKLMEEDEEVNND